MKWGMTGRGWKGDGYCQQLPNSRQESHCSPVCVSLGIAQPHSSGPLTKARNTEKWETGGRTCDLLLSTKPRLDLRSSDDCESV